MAVEKYGTFVAEALLNRLADFAAATSLEDIIVGEPTAMSDSLFKINLSSSYCLIFSANNRKIRQNSQGVIDWSSVNRIKILSVEPQEAKL